MTVSINKDNFEKEVMQSNQTVLVDFFAEWCSPCKMLSPVIEEIANERDDIKVVKINIDSEPELATQFGVMSIPNLFIIKNGRIDKNLIGLQSKDTIMSYL